MKVGCCPEKKNGAGARNIGIVTYYCTAALHGETAASVIANPQAHKVTAFLLSSPASRKPDYQRFHTTSHAMVYVHRLPWQLHRWSFNTLLAWT